MFHVPCDSTNGMPLASLKLPRAAGSVHVRLVCFSPICASDSPCTICNVYSRKPTHTNNPANPAMARPKRTGCREMGMGEGDMFQGVRKAKGETMSAYLLATLVGGASGRPRARMASSRAGPLAS